MNKPEIDYIEVVKQETSIYFKVFWKNLEYPWCYWTNNLSLEGRIYNALMSGWIKNPYWINNTSVSTDDDLSKKSFISDFGLKNNGF